MSSTVAPDEPAISRGTGKVDPAHLGVVGAVAPLLVDRRPFRDRLDVFPGGPFPGFVELVGSAVDGVVFFVGSIFFTSAAALQFVDACNVNGNRFRLVAFEPRSPDWWSSAVQLAGTIFFNVSTFDAMKAGLEATEYNRLVWAPDALGSICFLVSGIVAYVAVAGGHIFPARRSRGWWIAAVNLLGCIAFGISAVASHVIPSPERRRPRPGQRHHGPWVRSVF